jgi:hypothetical protein
MAHRVSSVLSVLSIHPVTLTLALTPVITEPASRKIATCHTLANQYFT